MKSYYLVCFAIVISLSILLSGCQNRQYWHVENYVVEGSGYFRIFKEPVKETKEYFVCGEKITLGIYPQETVITHKPTHSYKTTGPYKIRVHFTPGHNGENKKILIHEVKISSSLGNRHVIAEKSIFPITIVPEPFYHSSDVEKLKKRNPKYKISYNFLFNNRLGFKFLEKEIIHISFDVEVILNSISKRDEVWLRLIPILDSGAEFRMPGDGV
ncbi:MAG TPA: hypothetical protein DCO77_00430 [Nitrospiraceae bacterium]|nr:hypothetical protein [Nitrospiraceae bacterium]